MKAQAYISTALLLLVSPVQAQSHGAYGQAVARQQYCELPVGYAKMISTGRKYSPKSRYYEMMKDSTERTDRIGQIWRYAIDYAYDSATDEKDAEMTVWAFCMDKLR